MRQHFSVLLLIACTAASCHPVLDKPHVSFENYELWKNPEEAPETLPQRFLYKSASVKMAAHYGSSEGFGFQRQGAILQESKDPREHIYQYYLKSFSKGDWHIIQSHDAPKEELSYIMAESSSRRLLTVILRGESPVTIKIYYKPGNY